VSLIRRDPEADRLLADWFEEAHQGAGSPWLTPGEAEALALFALKRGEGVRIMEARVYPHSETPCDPVFEILGADAPGENWEDHQDPATALTLVRRKLRAASKAGSRLRYKLWLCPGAGR
jgi:hypothetical protein